MGVAGFLHFPPNIQVNAKFWQKHYPENPNSKAEVRSHIKLLTLLLLRKIMRITQALLATKL